MIGMKYPLVIEATEDPSFFGFYSPDLEGFTGGETQLKTACTRRDGGWQNTFLCSVNAVCPSHLSPGTPR
jgi:hypothetical protein